VLTHKFCSEFFGMRFGDWASPIPANRWRKPMQAGRPKPFRSARRRCVKVMKNQGFAESPSSQKTAMIFREGRKLFFGTLPLKGEEAPLIVRSLQRFIMMRN